MAFSSGVVQSGACDLIFPQIPNNKFQFSPRPFFSERLQVPLERNVHRLHCASRWRPTTTNQRNRNPRVFLSKKSLKWKQVQYEKASTQIERYGYFLLFSVSNHLAVRWDHLYFDLLWDDWKTREPKIMFSLNMFAFRGKNPIFESPVEGGF